MKLSIFALLFIAVAATAHAQTGCTDSPENPTALLALVGSAGAFVAANRHRFRRR